MIILHGILSQFAGTENALKGIRDFNLHFLLEALKPANPADAAMAIIKGGATQQHEIYFPYWEAKMVSLFRDWFPRLLESITIMIYQKPT